MSGNNTNINNWQHNSYHRRGVSYYNTNVQQRFSNNAIRNSSQTRLDRVFRQQGAASRYCSLEQAAADKILAATNLAWGMAIAEAVRTSVAAGREGPISVQANRQVFPAELESPPNATAD